MFLRLSYLYLGAMIGALLVLFTPRAHAGVVFTDTGPNTRTVYFPSSTMGNPGTYYEVPRTYSTSSGTFTATASVPMKNPAGVPVTINAGGAVPMSAVAKIIKKALPLVPVLGAGVALYDLVKEIGYDVESSPSGVVGSRVTTTSNYVYRNGVGGTQVCTTGPPEVARSCVCNAHLSVCQYSGFVIQNLSPTYFEIASPYFGVYARYDGNAVTGKTEASLQEIADAIGAKLSWPSTSKLPDAVAQSESLTGEKVAFSNPTVSGPATSTGPSSTSTSSTGNQSTTQTTYNHQYSGNTITTTTTTVTNNYNPSTNTTTTETTQSTPEEKPKDPCGLPDTPKCALEGGGTPTGDDIDTTSAEKTLDKVKDFLANPTSVLPAFPTINWTFALPSSCGEIPTPAFAPYMSSINVCQFQPMFHEIMTVVWQLAGLFGAISLFMKSSLGEA